MNTQKQVTITDLKGKFNKDFDTFGKMDPFLEFTLGKSFGKTEIASSAGKQPVWKDSVVLTYFDETQIVVKAYDDDATEKQFIGTGKLQIKSLRFPGGSIELTILTDNGQNIGTVTGKYTIKNLPQSPLLLIRNLRLQLGTQQKQILKSKPYIQFLTDENSTSTEPKEQIKGLSILWTDSLRMKIKQSSKITISLIDKDSKQEYLFKYECFVKEFRLQNGTKKFNVFNKDFQRFATLHFDYQTVNLVSKEESVKNLQKEKKAENQMTAFLIERISSELKIQGKDIYFKFIIGTNNYTSQVFEKNQKLFTLEVKKTLYAEEKENKLILVLYSKNLISDSILGYGHISLESLVNGEKKINLANQAKEDIGTVTLTLSNKITPSKVLNIENLSINLYESADLIGQSQPFVVAKIGNCSGSTQIGESNKTIFKRGIELKYYDEQFLEMQIWDEDAKTNQLLYSERVKLSELKNKGEHQIIFKDQKDDKSEPKAKLNFKYQLKNVTPQSPARKNTQKKMVETQSPKKQVVLPLPNPTPILNPVVQPQKQKPKVQTQRSNKVEELEKKPVKKEQVASNPKPYQTLQSKPIPVVLQNNKTEQIETQRLKEPSQKNQQQLKTKRDESMKKTIKQESMSINKSRETIVLPSIVAGSKFYGDKIFDKQSAATLQKSILAYSMPKANRFSNEPKYSGEPAYCMDSCFKPNPSKGVGFGFGGKRQFPQWMERNMKENPPPGAYFDDKAGTTSKGPTFGLSHKYYQKVVIPKEQKTSTTGQTVRKLSPIRDPPK